MYVPDPEGTARNCPHGCGLTTVLARFGDGRPIRVHCGTHRAQCPGRPTRQVPRTWTAFHRPAHAA
ncbi:hypothetical protein FHS29_005030 [Saccharothrix tamanrassetensis]|uniref:Uncharacterized protein n=1 Tax=Saccharothrix tamanrassetensis TaxID=1051531 RepID=A0A841CIV5_9PSEU|nr:hypothetical protein [Saccharothrix tamanrassetensis]MBB5958422.1 hypothetical protein [Saccharothrix tamanrassetensis]